ncbi:helix-turn-helix domain-containing protein [Yinghuangia sp. YIM S10712]|uniref:PucR family transcriptional regulator n=1 Tax=Yinghuangia sp. YIM S10712 TaxID=3436930 RepID=UPI003F53487D
MGIEGDSGTAAAGGCPPVRSGDGVGTAAEGSAGATRGRAGRAGNAVDKAVDNAVKRKAGRVAKVAKTGTVGGSGVVSSTQAAGTGTRETVRTLPTKRRVRAGSAAAEAVADVPPPECAKGPPPREDEPPPGCPDGPSEVSVSTVVASAGGETERTAARLRADTSACTDGPSDVALGRVVGPSGTTEPTVAGAHADTGDGSDVRPMPQSTGAGSAAEAGTRSAAGPAAPRTGAGPGVRTTTPVRAGGQQTESGPQLQAGPRESAYGKSAATAASGAGGHTSHEGATVPDDEFSDDADVGLSRVLLPTAAHALAVAGRLARAAFDAGADAGEIKYRADLLRDLLTGRLADPDKLPPRGLGALLDREVTVVVAEPDPLAGDTAGGLRRHQDALAAAWTTAVRLTDPHAVVAGYPGEIVAVLTAPQEGCATAAAVGREAAARVRAACGRIPRTFTTGISRPARGIGALPRAYEQAHRALAAGRRLQGPGAVTDFDRLGVFRLLAMLPVDGELERFAGEVLGPLAAGDDPEAGELRRTLHVLLETNLNVAETSRRLFVHYNTLRYRIGKLERLVGPFTQDSRLRLDLLIALETVHLADTAPRRPSDERRR